VTRIKVLRVRALRHMLNSSGFIKFTVRVAVVFKDRCQPKRCHLECIAFCPPQRTGTEVIWIDPETTKAAISEETCISCGICTKSVRSMRFGSSGLPEALKEDLVHQYGKNAFRLFRLPVRSRGRSSACSARTVSARPPASAS